MKTRILPAFFFPTKLVWIDDDEGLQNASAIRLSARVAIQSFTSPHRGIEFINTYRSKIQQQQYIQEDTTNFNPNKQAFILNTSAILQWLNDPERFNEISLLVMDYAMPGMNGIEALGLLEKDSLQKIMLTGEADHSIAVNAFNSGLIQRFIVKDSNDVSGLLLHDLRALQTAFFVENTSLITKMLIEQSPQQLHAINDPSFIEFFETLLKEKDIKEYYLADKNGSYLLVDKNKVKHWLCVQPAHILSEYVELAVDDNASEKVIESLKSKKYIPCFLENPLLALDPKKWEKLLHPAKIIQGHQTYYTSVIPANRN